VVRSLFEIYTNQKNINYVQYKYYGYIQTLPKQEWVAAGETKIFKGLSKLAIKA
jgi:hypothetical protein